MVACHGLLSSRRVGTYRRLPHGTRPTSHTRLIRRGRSAQPKVGPLVAPQIAPQIAADYSPHLLLTGVHVRLKSNSNPHAPTHFETWGSRGRRFKSCQPDHEIPRGSRTFMAGTTREVAGSRPYPAVAPPPRSVSNADSWHFPTAAQRTRVPDYGLFHEFGRAVWCGEIIEVSRWLALR